MTVDMKSALYTLILLAVVATAASAVAALQQHTFARYEPILERQPFGIVTPDAAAGAAGAAEVPVGPPFTKDLKMCAITEDATGVQVGFVNVAVNPPKSYLLRVGEMEDYIELVDADYQEEMALLRKNGEEHWISMDGSSGMSGSAPGEGGAGRSEGGQSASSDGSRRLSYAERLRRRRAERVREIEPPGLQGEDLKKHLESYQMELIRKGMPPLPMELTPEMDAQLVSEGVLPPVDDRGVVAP